MRNGRPSEGPGRQAVPRSYFQDFSLTETLPGGSSSMIVRKGTNEYVFNEDVDFTMGRFSLSTRFSAPVVFIGYGISDKANGIDDFAGTDIQEKAVLRLTGFPGSDNINSPVYKKLAGDNPRAAIEISRSMNNVIANRGAAGAHLDHMGIDNGKIWNGADDNASGTVAVMTIARAFAESRIKPKRTIVFCAWPGCNAS